MIRALLVFLALAFGGIPAESMEITGQGLMLGVNSSDLTGPDLYTGLRLKEGEGPRLGLVAGGFIVLGANEILAIQPEILFSQKGASFPADEGGTRGEYQLTLDYIEFPLLLRINIPLDAGVKPSIVFGPSIGYLVYAQSALTGDLADSCKKDKIPTTMDATDFFQPVDLGMVAGFGLEFPAGPGKVAVGIRQTLGLVTNDKKVQGQDRVYMVFNKVSTLLVGYSF